jgi:TolB-like protein
VTIVAVTSLEECGVEKQVIEEIPPPPKIEVIPFNRHTKKREQGLLCRGISSHY